MITYGEDIVNMYNALVKKDPTHFLKGTLHPPTALVIPPSGEWYLLRNTKTRGGNLYPVSSVRAGIFKQERELSMEDLTLPVSGFVPDTYTLKSAALRRSLWFSLSHWVHGRKEYTLRPLFPRRNRTLEDQIK